MSGGETEEKTSAWTTDTLHVHLQREIDDIGRLFEAEFSSLTRTIDARDTASTKMLDERYATQTKALDAAFIAQQTAMRTALEAAEKAVQAALTAAKEAVSKSEVAAEKRFESVNEFRAQLQDIIATLVSKVEVDAKFTSITDKMEGIVDRFDRRTSDLADQITSVERRVTADVAALDSRLSTRIAAIEITASTIAMLKGQMYLVAGLILTAIGVAVTLILAFNG